MDQSKDMQIIRNGMVRKYGVRGESVYKNWIHANGLDESKSLIEQRAKLKSAFHHASSNDSWGASQMNSNLRLLIECESFASEVYKDCIVNSQAERIKAEAEKTKAQQAVETASITKSFAAMGNSVKASDYSLKGKIREIREEYQTISPTGIKSNPKYVLVVETEDKKTFTMPIPQSDLKKYTVGNSAKVTIHVSQTGNSKYSILTD